ncbi:SMEK domain-containing protein [Niabella sp. 22666]|uniref:SMEK domain-containing protein n=1 Tax=Niabella sp. 22666 TaxID=3453954 RepID=UPI003F829F96
MIKSGQQLEAIIEMLTRFQTEIEVNNQVGLTNISKHSERLICRLLNLLYGYELESLNKDKPNFPGLDLGDEDESTAYQITSTKKASKIDDTLSTCIKFKHYEKFKTIKIFLLVPKQKSYKLGVITFPHFDFDVDRDIVDFKSLIKVIEQVSPIRLNAVYELLSHEIDRAIHSIKYGDEEDNYLLDPINGLKLSKMPYYFIFRCALHLKTSKASSSKIYTAINSLFQSDALKRETIPIMAEQYRISDNSPDLYYTTELETSRLPNYFTAASFKIKESSIFFETAVYRDEDMFPNFKMEMEILLISLFGLSKIVKENDLSVDIHIEFDANTKVNFFTHQSYFLPDIGGYFSLNVNEAVDESISDIQTDGLVHLFEVIAAAFKSENGNILYHHPFLMLDTDHATRKINSFKTLLNFDAPWPKVFA